ncbi:MAG: hypothetical protein Q8R45_14415 [Brevundimonas sp.]|uniref:hypothetical protein n=1 Tax=Brevundimonas sp. TaxID=1871086 RepID=UPI002732DAE4|nr:hypothetical protein [Brevundimonas sp.]MDP3658143.1 hypothetical protein [Brevundimonas sp.]MDZ4109685.1 hypothetical protein [Brevundimonas sp.]
MSLIAVTAAVLLTAQTFVPAPPYDEAEVGRLESCVYGGADMSKCGDFSDDVEALETCAARADLSGGPEGFLDQWSECDVALPCEWEKPEPGQTALVLRNCSARGVAASKVIAARWLAEIDGRLSAEDRALLAQMEKRMIEGLEAPTASDDPLRASARWLGTWTAYLRFLRVVQLSGKAAAV